MWKHADTEIRWLHTLVSVRDDPGPPALPPLGGFLRERWRQWFSPLGRLEGCWLAGAVSIANAHTATGAALLDLQTVLERVAAGGRRAYPPAGEPPPPLRDDIAWLTALERWGEAFLPEILGITLAHARLAGGVFALGRPTPSAYGAVLRAAEACLGHRIDPDRVAAGAALYHRRTRTWLAAWQTIAADPRRQVLALLREKARHGVGMHARIEIGGRPLDAWLAELASGEGEAFLEALLASPHKDRFLTRTLAFGGPMFGVFNQAEQDLLRRWLAWEQTGPSETAHNQPPMPGEGLLEACPPTPPPPEPKPGPAGRLRPARLYHRLLHPDRFPPCLPAAHRHVRKVLARAGRRGPPFPYSPDAFRRWVESLHAEAATPGPERAKPCFSRAACVWGIEQLAPAILVDGCWLAGALSLARTCPAVGQPLWRIFRDEVGDGKTYRNHANVYRRLLHEAGVDLPPFDSEAFIHHRGFVPGAFDLPAFLLAIGRFPEDFLAELLGLNLAIELSGLGHTYRRLAQELEHHGLDPTIVRLHQSIDNLASGHAALARDAITAHLEIMALGGGETVQRQWQRVWTGYRSLAVATRRFAWVLVILWGGRFCLPHLLSGHTHRARET